MCAALITFYIHNKLYVYTSPSFYSFQHDQSQDFHGLFLFTGHLNGCKFSPSAKARTNPRRSLFGNGKTVP